MPISTNEAFSVLEGWKENKSALVITGMRFRPRLFRSPQIPAVISEVDRDAESIVAVTKSSDGEDVEIPIPLAGAAFDFDASAADTEAVFLFARFPDGKALLISDSLK
jgi:hypothetical protein